MLTNTRLIELHRTANQCQQLVDKKCATMLEKDFADLYCLARDRLVTIESSSEEGIGLSRGPHISLLFGK